MDVGVLLAVKREIDIQKYVILFILKNCVAEVKGEYNKYYGAKVIF